MDPTGLDYILKKARRRQLPRRPDEHKGTRQQRLELIQKESEDFGRIIPVADHGRHVFGREMYERVRLPEVLYAAYEGLKGGAAGEDGVTPADLPAFAVHQRCYAAAQWPAFKRPPFHKTRFAAMDSSELSLVALACAPPEQSHKGMAVELPVEPDTPPEARRRREELQREPGAFLAVTAKEMDARAALMDELQTLGLAPKYHRFDFGLVGLKVEPKLLARVGTDPKALDELAAVMFAALSKQTRGLPFQSGLWLWDYSPCGWIFGDGEGDLPAPADNPHLVWNAMRWLGGIVKVDKDGRGYRPRSLRKVEIPKPDGGIRTLSIPPVTDRVAAKSALVVLEPMFDQVFLPSSVGCRRSLDRFDALAGLWRHYPRAPGKHILLADIQKAFDRVSHDALLSVIHRYIHSRDMRRLLERFVRRPGFENGVGIAQGCSLSPLFLNLLLHETLDKPLLASLSSDVVFYRYLDDLSLLGFGSEDEGRRLLDVIQELLLPVGLELHPLAPPHTPAAKTQIVNLANAGVEREYGTIEDGEPEREIDRYLGIGLRGGADGLGFFLPAAWRESVMKMFVNAEATIRRKGYAGEPGAHVHIKHAAEGWLSAFSPAWTPELRDTVPEEVVSIARAAGAHTDGLVHRELVHVWEAAHGVFLRRCHEES